MENILTKREFIALSILNGNLSNISKEMHEKKHIENVIQNSIGIADEFIKQLEKNK